MMCLNLSALAVLLLAVCSASTALPQWVDDADQQAELAMPEVVETPLPQLNQSAPASIETTFCKLSTFWT